MTERERRRLRWETKPELKGDGKLLGTIRFGQLCTRLASAATPGTKLVLLCRLEEPLAFARLGELGAD